MVRKEEQTGVYATAKIFLVLTLLVSWLACPAFGSLEEDFVNPPNDAKPWVYWFWLNGNISREGITSDLEAMKRVGIGGALIMEVDQGVPEGPVAFMSKEWRDLLKHAVSEAKRLGLQINMNNDAGWNGSGGPWIKPEQSMQKVVWTEVEIEGPTLFEGQLPQPETNAGYYRDIAVLAFPATDEYRISNIGIKAGFSIGPAQCPAQEIASASSVIEENKIVDITASVKKDGRLSWQVPAGKWTIIRFGHTTTGMQNSPAPASGRGLECDKLSKQGIEANFRGMIARLIEDVGCRSSKKSECGFVATHVDSWENGSQNWTPRMREEFLRLRGYDLLNFLPVLTGRVVGGLEVSERFLRDFRQTISDLVIENYAAHMRTLAHNAGLRFTVEAYGSPCDNIPYGGQADEPMGEFWTPHGATMETCKAMASAAHVYGKRIVGAEAFTADAHERWLEHPATLKPLADEAFCVGVNRLVIHRYAHQPWLTERKPGMTMGPWGQHYERTQTWWENSRDWHTYLSRCQYMLRQGLFMADICYVQSEVPFQTFRGHQKKGYDWDECPADVVLNRMRVANNRIRLPDGMNYKLLVLPDSQVMTPELIKKIRSLVRQGAIVVGPPPLRSPSLTNYPACDHEVRTVAAELWGIEAVEGTTKPTAKSPLDRRVGKGRVIWGISPEDVLAKSGIPPDFSSDCRLNYVHRIIGNVDVYFVANPKSDTVRALCKFRTAGRIPELWWPESGRIEQAAVYSEENTTTCIPILLGPMESVFVVFRKPNQRDDPVVALAHNGQQVLSAVPKGSPKVRVIKAIYGVLDDPNRTRDVTAKVQDLVDGGELSFLVSRMAAGDDPAYGIVKTLHVECIAGEKRYTISATDPEYIDLTPNRNPSPVCKLSKNDKRLLLTAWEPGAYVLTYNSGRKNFLAVPFLPSHLKITGPWKVEFPQNHGAPELVVFESLTSWSDYPDPSIRYFSGTAVYRVSFDVPPGLLTGNIVPFLDLGDVYVNARVILNGKDLGVLWKPPYRMRVDGALRTGMNELEIDVTNLWPNRLIGDEELPEDSERNPNGTLKSWPSWVLDGKPSPTGRHTFTTWRLWKKGEPLQTSGLMGPVKIVFAREVAVN